MSDEVTLKVKGQEFRGWTSIMIEKSMHQITGAFGLVTTDKFPGEAKKWNIALGDECIVEINEQRVITGYIEDIIIDYDAESHNIQFGGRDKTGDLADCSFDGEAKEWKGLSLVDIIRNLCNPFDIDVVVDSSVAENANKVISDSIKANEGDTVFEIIRGLCRMRAILAISYSDGKLTLTQAGVKYKANDVLESGKNILKGNFDHSNKDRFQTYIVKGQGVGEDTKPIWSPSSGSIGKATDEKVITRYRPIIIFADEKCDKGMCIKLAEWERNNRAGASRSLEYEIQGWTQSNGKIWPLNAMVQVKDNVLGVNETLLISAVSFTVNEAGSVTRMRVVDPDAFTVKPKPIKSGFDKPPWMRK